jgi:sigma-E factor negative regulatory protein RseA
MNEKLSALVDGELDRSDALAVIKSLGQDAEARTDWDCYHLIGDALRGDADGASARRRKASESIFARLAEEPTILAPQAMAKYHKHAVNGKTRIALAMAASVVTVSAIGIVAFQQRSAMPDGQGQVAQMQAPVSSVGASGQVGIVPVSTTAATQALAADRDANARVNDYLVVHRQFSNPSALRAATLTSQEPRQAAGK